MLGTPWLPPALLALCAWPCWARSWRSSLRQSRGLCALLIKPTPSRAGEDASFQHLYQPQNKGTQEAEPSPQGSPRVVLCCELSKHLAFPAEDNGTVSEGGAHQRKPPRNALSILHTLPNAHKEQGSLRNGRACRVLINPSQMQNPLCGSQEPASQFGCNRSSSKSLLHLSLRSVHGFWWQVSCWPCWLEST